MSEFWKRYLLELCCSYTIISVAGAIINIFVGGQTNNANVIVMFTFCAIIVFVLSIHKLFDRFSPLFMIVAQYVISLGLCSLIVFIISRFDYVSPKAWFEYFRSFTIPYIIGAALYYYRVFSEAKKHDTLIKEIQQLDEKEKEEN